MGSRTQLSRRRALVSIGALAGAVAGCTGGDSEDATTPSRTRTADPTATAPRSTEATENPDERAALIDAIDSEAVAIDPDASADGLGPVATRLAQSPIVGIGENSHGVSEFKGFAHRLVRRLVADHGYRLVAIEGTIGDFGPVDRYVAGADVDLDAAMGSIEFYFWRTDAIRRLFEWLREFNAGRPATDRAVVRGYDAQFFDVNATAVRSYLKRVDPAYLDGIDERLMPLTRPLYERHDADLLTEARLDLLDSLGDRLRARRDAYVAETSTAEWRLARRHVRTLERGLRFQAALRAERYTQGKRVRDAAMAENVSWLRDWTGADRAVVLGSTNHTMRNDGSGEAARMGQHLADEYGDDYYSLGCLFGTGRFRAPTGPERTAFGTHDLEGPVPGTLAATLVEAAESSLFLDFETARRRAPIDGWLDDTSQVGVSVPRAADRGAVPLPAAPDAVYDGVAFVRDVTPASFASEG
jgi:erythromycin esterase